MESEKRLIDLKKKESELLNKLRSYENAEVISPELKKELDLLHSKLGPIQKEIVKIEHYELGIRKS